MDFPNKKELKAKKTKEKILDAATQLFYKYGYNEVTTDQIAELAEVSKGGIFHHFSSKEELAVKVLVNSIEEYRNYLPMIEELDLENIDGILREVLTEILRMGIEQPGFTKLLIWFVTKLDQSSDENDFYDLIKKSFTEVFLPYIDAIKMILEKYGHEEPYLKSILLFAMLDGITIYLSYVKKIASFDPQIEFTMEDFQKIPDIIMELFFSKKD